ncbi:MAG: ribonuclease HIII [Candidatus Gastranaerophilales bacterium]|nr:ribonuclease HIII [Candidatus Gastranaerophilales bacterium]
MNIFSEKVPINKQAEIKNFILQNFDAIVSLKQYALWEIKNKDFVATFYNSSKFVIQGKNISALLECLSSKFDFIRKQETVNSKQNVDFAKQNQQLFNFSPVHLLNCEVATLPRIGTDESGKGDFFGPLVVAGVLLDEKNLPLFEELGIKDSKTLKDEQMLKMAQQVQKHSVFSVVTISNAKYNELYADFKNLNKLLAWGHARAIENILEKSPCEYALSDKFGDESLIQNALMKNGRTIHLEQRVRAESDIAVAAASVLARATFVQKMQQIEKFYGCKFPKGCNDIVKDCAKEFIQKWGQGRLIEVCKAHFKTYKEIIN